MMIMVGGLCSVCSVWLLQSSSLTSTSLGSFNEVSTVS